MLKKLYKINKTKEIYGVPLTSSPAAVDTLCTHFKDTNRQPDFYDLIITGDLGVVGKSIILDMMLEEGFDLSQNYNDCGCMIYDIEKQDMHAGGSGCGCGAVTLCGHIMNSFKAKTLKNVLFIGTGALLSPTSSLQGESIPSVAHAIAISI